MWVYEGHLGGLYCTDEQVPDDYLYCEQCGDYDWEIGHFNTFAEFVAAYANNLAVDEKPWGSGGFYANYIFKEIAPHFPDKLTKEEYFEIIKKNRTQEDEE